MPMYSSTSSCKDEDKVRISERGRIQQHVWGYRMVYLRYTATVTVLSIDSPLPWNDRYSVWNGIYGHGVLTALVN